MARKAANLIYGVDETPPWTVSAMLGLQHVVVLTSGWVLVVVIVTTIGGTKADAAAVLRMSMIASGVATILQSLPRSRFGSGYFCPIGSGPAYVSASILAGKLGGLPAIFTMTAISGLLEALVARIVPRLRALFPPEVTGLVVTMVGVELITVACTRFLGAQEGGASPQGAVTAIAAGTLAAMIGPTVWGRGQIRLYPVLIGIVVGYSLASLAGVLPPAERLLLDAPMFGLPAKAQAGWRLDVALLPAFLVASLASTLKSVGDLTLCQRINDADWTRTDMRSVSGGITAGAIGTGLSGLLGGVGQSTFSSNVGLSLATGATSRSIAIPCGLLVILLAFLPRFAALFAAMPDPVMGAILVYVACYMILAGIQVMTSRMLDARRTFVVGIALIFGLSVDMIPGLYRDVPAAIQPLFSSSLSVSTVLVVLLNLVFRIGVAKRQVLELTPGVDRARKIFEFMEAQGGAWGARREVIDRAAAALNELLQSASRLQLVEGPVRAEVRFDEFSLDVEVRYRGRLLELPSDPPTVDALLTERGAVPVLAAYLIRHHYADDVTTESRGEQCRVHLHFEH